VLQAAAPNIDLAAMEPSQREKLRLMVSNNCDAAVKSARTMLDLIEVQTDKSHEDGETA
jgi:hypothetical protein